MPEDDNEDSDEYQTREENKSNSISVSNDQSKSNELSKSNDNTMNTIELTKSKDSALESDDMISSIASSVSSSKLSLVNSPIKAFKMQEDSRRISNISVESLVDYNKRKTDGKVSNFLIAYNDKY